MAGLSEEPVLEITGKQLSSGRDCLRDDDWQVYKLSIVEAGKKPVKLLASKTGGDAAKILAPMEMHGSEEEDYQQHLADCSSTARLDFCCSTISVSCVACLTKLPLLELDTPSLQISLWNSEKVYNFNLVCWS